MSKRKPNIVDYDRVREIDWARLAAFIDGEGSILIQKSPLRYRKLVTGLRKRYENARPTHRLVVCVANTDKRLMHWLISSFGGVSYFHAATKRSKKPCLIWSVSSRQAGRILTGCLPYFVIKGDQARIGLELRRLTAENNQARITDDNFEAREMLFRSLKRIRSERLGDETEPVTQVVQ